MIVEELLTCRICGRANETRQELAYWSMSGDFIACPDCMASYHGFTAMQYVAFFWTKASAYAHMSDTGQALPPDGPADERRRQSPPSR